jgi:hypothetical protein
MSASTSSLATPFSPDRCSRCHLRYRLGCLHRGDDHRGAADLLRTATPDGAKLATVLGRLLSLKDAAHYGVPVVSARKAADATKWAAQLVERAEEETER